MPAIGEAVHYHRAWYANNGVAAGKNIFGESVARNKARIGCFRTGVVTADAGKQRKGC